MSGHHNDRTRSPPPYSAAICPGSSLAVWTDSILFRPRSASGAQPLVDRRIRFSRTSYSSRTPDGEPSAAWTSATAGARGRTRNGAQGRIRRSESQPRARMPNPVVSICLRRSTRRRGRAFTRGFEPSAGRVTDPQGVDAVRGTLRKPLIYPFSGAHFSGVVRSRCSACSAWVDLRRNWAYRVSIVYLL
jgi:hypothetical protein